MNDWRVLFGRLLDGEELSELETRALATALDKGPNRREVEDWLRFDAQLWGHLASLSAEEVALSRERLLAKAVLREKHKQVAPAAPRRRLAWTGAAAAAAVLAAILAGWLLLGGRYPRPRAEGDFRLVRGGGVIGATSPLRQGDRLHAGRGGARLTMGGYCHLTLEPNAELVLRGEPRKEMVELQSGRVVSRIEPERGEFRVLTPLGTIEAAGTEFVTAVEHPRSQPTDNAMGRAKNPAIGTLYSQSQLGEDAMGKLKKSAIVTVMVVSGAVAYHFGDSTGLLSAGMGRAFAAEGAGGAVLPDGIRGFKGLLVGTIVSKGERDFVLRVEKVATVWKQNKAPNPDSVVGKDVMISLRGRSRLLERHLHTLRRLKAGDRIVVEAFHLEGDRLTVIELLRKAEAPAEEKERAERERRRERREEGEGERPREREGRREEAERAERERARERREEGEREPRKEGEGRREEAERAERERARERREEVERERRREGEARREGVERREGEERRERRKEGERERRREGEARREEGEGAEREERRDRPQEGEREGRRGLEGPKEVTVTGVVRAGHGEERDAGVVARVRVVEEVRADGGVVEREATYLITNDVTGDKLALKADGRRAVIEGTLETKRRGRHRTKWLTVKRFKVLGRRRLKEGEGGKPAEREEWEGETQKGEEIQGFRGILQGTILGKGERAFVLKVERVKPWRTSRAKEPNRIVGTRVTITLGKGAVAGEQLLKKLAELKPGDRVAVAATCGRDGGLTVAEVLRKTQ